MPNPFGLFLIMPNDDRKLCEREYIQTQELGSGGYASVFQACKDASKKDCNYVVKVFKDYDQKISQPWLMQHEVDMHKKAYKLMPKHVIKLVDHWTCERGGFIMYELADTDLHDFLDDHNRKTAVTIPGSTHPTGSNFGQLVDYCASITRTFMTHGLYHNDAKPANFLLKFDRTNNKVIPFLHDWGLAYHFTNPKKLPQFLTPYKNSVEVVKYLRKEQSHFATFTPATSTRKKSRNSTDKSNVDFNILLNICKNLTELFLAELTTNERDNFGEAELNRQATVAWYLIYVAEAEYIKKHPAQH